MKPQFSGTKHGTKAMATLKALKAINRPGMHATPTRTLYLNIASGGSRQWVQRLTIAGKRHHLGLGSLAAVPYAVASKAAAVNLGKTYMGIDVVAERREAKRLAAVPTFEQMTADTFAALRSRWSSAKTANKWRSLLINYAGELKGKRVDEITTQDVLNVLLPAYRKAPDSARRCRQNIRAVMGTAEARGYVSRNVAGDAISGALPTQSKRTKKHHPALAHKLIARSYSAIGENENIAARLALKFIILTAARSIEARAATWSEIDLDAATWTIPGARMKTGVEHRIPLSPAAVGVLREAAQIRDTSELVFPSAHRVGGVIDEKVVLKMLRSTTDQPATVHGLRSSFRSWCADTGQRRELAEAALAHTVAGVEGCYQRSDLFEARRAVMESWCRFVTQVSAKVIALNAA